MSTSITRREALKLASLALLPQQDPRQGVKKVIVAGGGIGGLSCAFELVRRGHDVSVLEASARTGGHVFTFREGLDDGLLYGDGAEHFTQPGYEKFWSYVREGRGHSQIVNPRIFTTTQSGSHLPPTHIYEHRGMVRRSTAARALSARSLCRAACRSS